MGYYMSIDSEGLLISFYNTEINDSIPENAILISEQSWNDYFNNDFIKPIWDGEKWVEGLSQEDKDILINKPSVPTDIELLRLETAQANAEMFEMVLMMTGGMM